MCPYLHTTFNRVSGKASLMKLSKKTEEGKEAGYAEKRGSAYQARTQPAPRPEDRSVPGVSGKREAASAPAAE